MPAVQPNLVAYAIAAVIVILLLVVCTENSIPGVDS